MASEKPEEQAETQAPAPPAKGGKGNMLPIMAGGLVFVIFVVIFSIKFGVFDQTAPEQTPTTADALEVKTDKQAQAEQGHQDDFYGQYYGAESTEEHDSGVTFTEQDSLKQVAWYEQQKREIGMERAQLEEEKADLQRLHDRTEMLLKQREGLEAANLAALAKLYESMKSDQLVPILANLPDDKVSLIISRMKKQKASEVMGKIDPERAARITSWLLSLEAE
ncbi:MAG: hypothetical protein ABIJ61_12120 [bacterium]